MSKALDSTIDGRTRESGNTGDAGNTSSSQLLCIEGSDKVLLSLIQMRKQQAVFLLEFFGCAHTESITHWASIVTFINFRDLGLVDGGQPPIQLLVPPPLQAHQVAVIPRGDRIEIITGDHTSIADEDQAVEPESPVQVGDGLADGGVVHLVAGPDMMRDRPAGHHHHGDDHLDIVRLAIAAVAVLGEAGRPGALEVGAGNV